MTEKGSNPEEGLWRMSYWSRDHADSMMKSREEGGCSADKDEVHPGKDKFQVWLPDGRHADCCKAKEQGAGSAKAWMPMLLYPAKTEKEPGGEPLGT